MSDRFRVGFIREFQFAANLVRLVVIERRGDGGSYLMADGTWRDQEGATAIEGDFGILLPADAIEPLAVAIAEFQGHVSHGDTEARVLREWLTVERSRVDVLLRRASEP